MTFRKLKGIIIDKFKADVKQASDKGSDIYDLMTLRRILDRHAPIHQCIVALRKPTPWTSEDIKPEKKKRRRLERKWRRT